MYTLKTPVYIPSTSEPRREKKKISSDILSN